MRGEIIYVNYGTVDDFARLATFNVSALGKIALVRYGEIYRGDKVANAAAAGAIGCLIFSDPITFAPNGTNKVLLLGVSTTIVSAAVAPPHSLSLFLLTLRHLTHCRYTPQPSGFRLKVSSVVASLKVWTPHAHGLHFLWTWLVCPVPVLSLQLMGRVWGPADARLAVALPRRGRRAN